jgi:endoglucanase
MPESDTLTSYVVGTGYAPYKSSCATGDFAAVMAIAQRVYKPFDEAFAERAGEAAARAWTWLNAHPNVTFVNPPGVSTGEYGDADCSDERLWAAAELWRSTGGDAYHTHFLANYSRFVGSLWAPAWPSVGPMALWTYALAGRADRDAAAVDSIRQASLRVANQLVDLTASNAYRIALRSDDFFWGSNSQAANFSLALMIANVLAPDHRYTEAALENLHYLLGRNAFSVSWVTAVGSRWFMHPHHRPGVADGIPEPWPGMLSGGPNKNREDPVLQQMPANLPPMRVWADDQGSWASNEICLNWNAPLVFVLAGAVPEPQRRYRVPPPPGRRR